MTQQKAPTIERYEVVQVASHKNNSYGDLLFIDSLGKEYKIGNKRPQFFGAIIDGRAVKLGYAIYKGKEYIATAELYDGQVKLPQTEPIHTAVKPETQPAPQAVGMMTKEIGDHIRAGTLSKFLDVETANNILAWYRGQMLGITKVAFDGAKQPKYKKPEEK